MATRTSFTSEEAPCGRVVEGVRFSDRDDEGLVVEHLHYACGCHNLRDEFHEGSCTRKVVHHNGKVLVEDEIRGE